MSSRISPSVFGPENKGALVIVFSPRERVRDILTVGLVQCGYRVIQASTSYLTIIKASQIIPSLIIADISCDNPKDIVLVSRLQKSIRTRHIAILLIVPKGPASISSFVKDELNARPVGKEFGVVSTLEYPFAFAEFLNKIKPMITVGAHEDRPAHPIVSGQVERNRLVANKLLDPSVQVETKLHEIEMVLHKQWAFPFTVIKALDILESEDSCCTELAKCISADPSVSSAILKVANTVYYARRNGRITDVKDAVVRLGFRETRSLVACLALIDLSPVVYKDRGFDRQEFWLHSLTVGLIAEKLCAEADCRRPELAFVAGLIHDLGKIPLDNNFDELFPKLLDETTNSVCPFYIAEEKLLGFNHAMLGHYLTNQWNFPSPISLGVLNHHNPERILKTSPASDRIIQESVFIANTIAKAMNFGHSCDEILDEIPAEMLRELRLAGGPTERFFQSILHNLNLFCKYLNIAAPVINFHNQNETPKTEIIVVYDSRVLFHPLVIALKNHGFKVHVVDHFTPELENTAKVVISLPEKGLPLDIMLYGEDKADKETPSILKIFLVETAPTNNPQAGLIHSDLVFMDRRNLDMRILVYTIDRFLAKISTIDESPNTNIPQN